MGSITFDNLKAVDKISPNFTYVDIHLDLKENVVLTEAGNESPRGKDIEVDFDEAAIRNSIVNIFNTTPGERFLIPEFGANLRKYLFKPVTESVANQIGRTVLNAVEKWEPRVTVEHVRVEGRPFGAVTSKDTGRFTGAATKVDPISEDEYVITVIIGIPALKRKVSLEGVLTRSGFTELKNS